MTVTRDTRPAHLLAAAGDRRSLCGIKDPLPCVTVEAAPRHVAGWGMAICGDCARHPRWVDA